MKLTLALRPFSRLPKKSGFLRSRRRDDLGVTQGLGTPEWSLDRVAAGDMWINKTL